jgi:serine/threonine protein kinase
MPENEQETDVPYFIELLTKNRFRDVQMIGQGNQSEGVYLATSPENVKCVVKVIPYRNMEHITPDAAKREVDTLKDLEPGHHIVGFKDSRTNISDAHLFVIMESFWPSAHLKDFVQNKQFGQDMYTPDSYCDILDKTLHALHYVHNFRLGDGKVGIFHRDVKPENILVNRRREVRLIDFGTARRLEVLLTRTGGTPGYRAFECRTGAKPDCRADAFSVGVIAYQLFSKDLERRSENDLAEKIAILQYKYMDSHNYAQEAKEYADLLKTFFSDEKRKQFPQKEGADLFRIVQKAVQYDKSARYATAEAMRIDLNLAFWPDRVSAINNSVAGATTPEGALTFLKAYESALDKCQPVVSLDHISDSLILGATLGKFKACREQVAESICGCIYDRFTGTPEMRLAAFEKCIAKIGEADQKKAREYFRKSMMPGRKPSGDHAAMLERWKKFFKDLPSAKLAELWDTV